SVCTSLTRRPVSNACLWRALHSVTCQLQTSQKLAAWFTQPDLGLRRCDQTKNAFDTLHKHRNISILERRERPGSFVVSFGRRGSPDEASAAGVCASCGSLFLVRPVKIPSPHAGSGATSPHDLYKEP